MRKILSITVLFVAISSLLFAQQVPQGMKYQAVARNLKGDILANEQIVLKISLTSQQNNSVVTHYSELHNVKTNELGLFSLVVGEGESNKSDFKAIPWSSENIWMEVAIADKAKGGFTVISSSKLLAVPYAFHAETAGKISGNKNFTDASGGSISVNGTTSGGTVSGNSWNTVGNYKTNSVTDYVGTADNTDFVVRTNNKEVLRFTKDGKLITPGGVGLELGGNLQVNGDSVIMKKYLFVGENVVLNYKPWTLAQGSTPNGTPILGQTINRGNFTVTDGSSTSLTGSLTVKKFVRFDSIATSTSATTGALVVKGGVGIGENLNVDGVAKMLNNATSTDAQTGALVVTGGVGIGEKLNVSGVAKMLNTTTSTSATTGALVVTGGVGIGEKLNVSGVAKMLNNATSTDAQTGALVVTGGVGIGENLNVGGVAKMLNSTTSTDATTGALVVTGGAGIGENLNVGGIVKMLNGATSTTTTDGAVVVTGGVGIGENLNVGGNTKFGGTLNITNTTESGATNTGALVVAGGTGIGKNLNVGGNTNVVNDLYVGKKAGIGITYPNVSLALKSPSSIDFPFYTEVEGTPNKFYMNKDGQLYLRSNKAGPSNNAGNFAMLVDAQNQGLMIRLNEKIYPDGSNKYVSFSGTDGASYVIRGRIEGQTLDELYNSFDYIWFQSMNAVDKALSVAMVIVDLIGVDDADAAVVDGIELLAGVAEWTKASLDLKNNVGVTYESGSGDYAEWLKKENLTEQFSFGDIVSVRGGMISKNTSIADHYLVVSMSPIVLGNMPPQGQQASYEKIAFMGQVPVKVTGHVNIGDYIIPSGSNDGLGIAVSKSKMTIQQYKNIIGVAWSKGNSENGYSLINVAIGITPNNLVDKIADQEKEINKLKNSFNSVATYLAAKDPSFKMPDIGDIKMLADNDTESPTIENNPKVNRKNLNIEQIKNILLENKLMVTDVLANARLQLQAEKINFDKYPKIKRMLTDSDYFIESIGKDPSDFR